MRRTSLGKRLHLLLLAVVLCAAMSCAAEAKSKSRPDATAGIWSRNGKYVTVNNPGGTRSYRLYNQRSFGTYFRSYGCITTAVSMAASGFGVDISPKGIRNGKSSVAWSERYALSQLHEKRRNRAMSLRGASQILTNMGIPNRRVTAFSPEAAEKEIRAHLQSGRPVIVKVSKAKVGGVKFTIVHHALLLIGICGDYVVFANPSTGGINSSRVGSVHRGINLPLNVLVEKFMFSSTSDTESYYVSRTKGAGGYILVG